MEGGLKRVVIGGVGVGVRDGTSEPGDVGGEC